MQERWRQGKRIPNACAFAIKKNQQSEHALVKVPPHLEREVLSNVKKLIKMKENDKLQVKRLTGKNFIAPLKNQSSYARLIKVPWFAQIVLWKVRKKILTVPR